MSDSKYTFIARPNGFRIEGRDRTPVEVVLCPTYWQVSYDGDLSVVSRQYGFFDYYRLCEGIAYGLMLHWKPPQDRWLKVREWAEGRTAWAINSRVHAQWKRLLPQVAPDVLAVHRAIFAATFTRNPWLSYFPGLYEHPYIVSDIINFRAAAIAAAYVHDLYRASRSNRVYAPSELEALVALAEAEGLDFHMYEQISSQLTAQEAVKLMSDWRALFSPTDTTYRSLDRTLINLPGAISPRLVCNLNRAHLVRPVVERLELMITLLSWDGHSRNLDQGFERALNWRVFEYARTEDIKEAMRRVAEHTHNDLSPRRTQDVRFLVQFLIDYPEEHRGNIMGLAKKSIRWHKEQHEQGIARQIDRLGYDTETVKPPIPLPDISGVRLLDTVGAVFEEGLHMEHCVASYAREAVDGQCFLFHVDHDAGQATVEVGPDGRVVQAHGPRNQRNGAVEWGKRVLNRWGRDFPNNPTFRKEATPIVPAQEAIDE